MCLQIPNALYKEIEKRAVEKGFDRSKIRIVPQMESPDDVGPADGLEEPDSGAAPAAPLLETGGAQTDTEGDVEESEEDGEAPVAPLLETDLTT